MLDVFHFFQDAFLSFIFLIFRLERCWICCDISAGKMLYTLDQIYHGRIDAFLSHQELSH